MKHAYDRKVTQESQPILVDGAPLTTADIVNALMASRPSLDKRGNPLRDVKLAAWREVVDEMVFRFDLPLDCIPGLKPARVQALH